MYLVNRKNAIEFQGQRSGSRIFR